MSILCMSSLGLILHSENNLKWPTGQFYFENRYGMLAVHPETQCVSLSPDTSIKNDSTVKALDGINSSKRLKYQFNFCTLESREDIFAS